MPASQMRQSTESRRAGLAREALAIIERDFAGPVELDDVAREIATSRRQLQRALKEATGFTFRECICQIRMRHARRLLAAGASSREAAHQVGYSQPAQFAKAFRRVYGMSPTQARSVPYVLLPPAAGLVPPTYVRDGRAHPDYRAVASQPRLRRDEVVAAAADRASRAA